MLAHPKIEPDGASWNIGCAPMASFAHDLDRVSSGHASFPDTRDGAFVTP